MQEPNGYNGFHQLIKHSQRDRHLPSVVAAAVLDDESVFAGAVGIADVDGSLPAEPETQYRIGSITKTFTAALVVSLAKDGVLALDDRVGEHIEGTKLGRVTIVQLLSHSGGLQREPMTPMWQTFEGPDEAELAASLPASELVAAPGERWHYSNLGYAVLGQVVRQMTGQDCEALIQERFLDPLGLSRTSWQSMEPAAVGYRLDPYQDLLHVEPDMQQRAAGMGGQMWSTTGDLIEWAQALMGRRPEVLPVAVVDAMHTLRVMVDVDQWSQGWGLGLILTRSNGKVYAGHTGAMPGFGAALVTDRTTGLAVAVLVNTMDAATAGSLAFELVDKVVSQGIVAPTIEPWKPGDPCPTELLGLLGSWWFEAGETVFSWRDGALQAELRAGAGGVSVFVEEDTDRYRVVSGRELGEVLVVRRDGDGVATELLWATYPYSRQPR